MIETEKEFAIRPYDVDMAGIVSNIVYVRWLEDLRMELLHEYFSPRQMFERNLLPVVVRTEIDYRASLRFLDECRAQMRVTEIGRTSLVMQASFRNQQDTVAAEAKQVGAFIDSRTNRAVPLPEEVRRLFELNN